MGHAPQVVRLMTYWQFLACADGYALANGAKPKLEAPSDEAFLAWADSVKVKPNGKNRKQEPPLSENENARERR